MPGIAKSRTAIVLAILASVFLAVFFWRKDELPSPASEAVERLKVEQNATVETVVDSKQIAQTRTKATTAISSYKLPTYDIPFDEVIDVLKQASQMGEAQATCRLAIELLRCQAMLAMDQKVILDYLNEPVRKNMGATGNAAMENLNYDESQTFLACRQLHEDDLLKTQALLEKAMQQKQVDAMVLWASGEWIRTRYGRSSAYLKDPAFIRWQALAIPTMYEALRRGSYGAAMELAIAYNTTPVNHAGAPPYDLINGGSLFYGLVKDDAKQAYTFSILINLLSNYDFSSRSHPGLSAGEARAAEQNAWQMFQQWFGGKKLDRAISASNFGMRNQKYPDCGAGSSP